MFIRKLVISNLLNRRVRAGLTIAAVALSVSLVVAVTSGYGSVIGAVSKYVETWFGTIDAQIGRQHDPHGSVSSRIITALRADPMVKRADGRIEMVTPLLDASGKSLDTKMATVIGIDRPSDTRIQNLRMHAGQFFDNNNEDVCVIDQALAEQLKLKIGDRIGLAGVRKVFLRIVGIVHKPEAMAQHIQTVYLPLTVAQRYMAWNEAHASGPQVNRIYIELNRGVEPREFERKWKTELPRHDPLAKLRLTRDVREHLDKNLIVLEVLSYLGGVVSMLAAMFIVFSALSMGVSERQRTLAMLRAVGALRSQIAKLVVVEGILLAGTGALIGAPLGWLWVKVLSLLFPDVFTAGVITSWGGVALGVGGSIAAALLASVLPAWHATRVSPLEALAPDASPPPARLPLATAIAGALLIAIDPLLFFGPVGRIVEAFGPEDPAAVTTNVQLILHFLIGLPGIMLGFFLIAPAVIKFVERSFATPIARLFGLSPALLRQQLSSGMWRAAGTAAALMVGLAVLVVMQVQGNTALKGWKLPTRFPDLFIVATTGAQVPADTEGAQPSPATSPGTPTSRPAATQPQSRPGWSSAFPAKPSGDGAGPATKPGMLATAFSPFLGKKPPATAPATSPSTSPATAQKKPGLLEGIGSLFGIGGPKEEGPKAGIEIDQVKILEKVPGIRGNEIMPIAIASPQFGHGMTSIILTAMNPEATMFFGIDPSKAFHMMELEFRDGTAASAERFLSDGQALRLKRGQTWKPASELITELPDGRKVPKGKGVVLDGAQVLLQGLVQRSADGSAYVINLPGAAPQTVPADQVERVEHGRFIIVTNEFKELKGLGVGDSFPLKRVDGRIVQYSIVGVVWSPGIDVIVSVFDMGRQFDQRTASSVFGSLRDAKEDFGVERIYLFAVNIEPTTDRDKFVKSLNKTLRTEGMRAGDVRDIKDRIVTAFNRLLLLASMVAFAALAVASLGVTNTVMAGIRTRRWQFGVLRSIGLTRGQLLRLVLAEAALLGVVACCLGLGAGSIMAADAHALQIGLIGYNPPIDVPWTMIWLGIGIVMFIALGASLWPAVHVARSEPLRLLQAGRAAS